MTEACKENDCSKPALRRGWCWKHYNNWRKYGDPQASPAPRPDAICEQPKCDQRAVARGLCNKHWKRWRRHGDPDALLIHRSDGSASDRFWDKVDKSGECWIWLAGKTSDGYGAFAITSDETFLAHRFSLMETGETLPDELVVDHICGVRACVNPEHLRIVTLKQNREHLTKLPANNTSGALGVSPNKGKWQANVTHDGKRYYLGSFGEVEDAEAVVVAKRNELFTHNDMDRK